MTNFSGGIWGEAELLIAASALHRVSLLKQFVQCLILMAGLKRGPAMANGQEFAPSCWLSLSVPLFPQDDLHISFYNLVCWLFKYPLVLCDDNFMFLNKVILPLCIYARLVDINLRCSLVVYYKPIRLYSQGEPQGIAPLSSLCHLPEWWWCLVNLLTFNQNSKTPSKSQPTGMKTCIFVIHVILEMITEHSDFCHHFD